MQINKIHIIFFPIILIIFIAIKEYFSIIPWVAFFFVGKYIAKNIFKSVPSKNNFIVFYYIFSFIGLIICIDNYYNFNSLSGFGIDDENFLNSAKFIIRQQPTLSGQNDISLFSYFLAVIAFPISFFKDVSLTDLISVNWLLAAIIGVLLEKMIFLYTKKNISLFLLLLAYPFQFIISDSFTRLYRDNLIILFILVGLLGWLTSKKKVFVFSMIPVGLLRIANIIFLILYLLFNKIIVKHKRLAIYIAFGFLFILLFIEKPLMRIAMMYGSEYSRIERYKDAFKDINADEIDQIRFSEFSSSGNELQAKSFQKQSISAVATRAIFSYFYPLKLKSPKNIMKHGEYGVIKGFYIFYIVNWVNTLSLCIVTPLLIIGLFYNRSPKILALSLVYFVFLMLVLLISGQIRHTIGAYIFNSIFVSVGFYKIKINKQLKQFAILFGMFILFGIVAYNIYNYNI